MWALANLSLWACPPPSHLSQASTRLKTPRAKTCCPSCSISIVCATAVTSPVVQLPHMHLQQQQQVPTRQVLGMPPLARSPTVKHPMSAHTTILRPSASLNPSSRRHRHCQAILADCRSRQMDLERAWEEVQWPGLREHRDLVVSLGSQEATWPSSSRLPSCR